MPDLTHEQISLQLYQEIKDFGYPIDEYLKDKYCDIDPEFMGFVDIYRHLSLIIPQEYVVYDFGAGYGPQGFYFQKHARYIAIAPETDMIEFPWGEYYNMTTGKFLANYPEAGMLKKSFAICSYVPPWFGENSMQLVKERFQNVFTFYP